MKEIRNAVPSMFSRVIVNENRGEDVGGDRGINPLQDCHIEPFPEREIIDFGLVIYSFLLCISRWYCPDSKSNVMGMGVFSLVIAKVE